MTGGTTPSEVESSHATAEATSTTATTQGNPVKHRCSIRMRSADIVPLL
jgi:hypothetical protein